MTCDDASGTMVLSVRVPTEQVRALDLAAELAGMSRSAAARLAVEAFIATAVTQNDDAEVGKTSARPAPSPQEATTHGAD